MIAIIDYGMGNLRSVQKGFEKMGYQADIITSPEELGSYRGVVLPGVGAFADAMACLRQTGFDQGIREAVAAGTPVLGICLGLQLLFEYSEENGLHQGLGIFPGGVVKFELPQEMKVPHMGWNQIDPVGDCPVLKGIPAGAHFYFVHSYYVVPKDENLICALTDYGVRFSAVVGRENVFGIQFHPEKSSSLGLKILKNFGELIDRC